MDNAPLQLVAGPFVAAAAANGATVTAAEADLPGEQDVRSLLVRRRGAALSR